MRRGWAGGAHRWVPAVVATVVGLDQLSKWAAVAGLTQAFASGEALSFSEKLSRFLWTRHPGRAEAVSVLDDFWHFRYVENPGITWGVLAGSGSALRTPLLLTLSLLMMALLVVYLRRTAPAQKLLRMALALILGGAMGNFLDRVRLGYVIDFIDWHWFDRATWPTFNVADIAITLGGLILAAESILTPQGEG
jgi:signal peptidase II